MAKKKKAKTQLPRLTLLGYSRADLVAFVTAVESLRLLVNDLRLIADEMKAKRPPTPKVPAPPEGAGP